MVGISGKKWLQQFICSLVFLASLQAFAEKEWTILVYLNGHNNLSEFGAEDINEMEAVGSTDNVNIVVQWASVANNDTRRLLVQQDSNTTAVTSPVVQSLPRVDMGDYKNLVEFVAWAKQNYPAKKYFIDVWNHGSGWHRTHRSIIRDISWDDYTGSFITTEQLGTAMREIAQNLGQKVEVYGSDACLMNMAEVGAEMADSVNYMVGSEEVEPGPGWDYKSWLTLLTQNPTVDGAEAGRFLAESYLASYSGGNQGTEEVQLSVLNLNYMNDLYAMMSNLSEQIRNLSAEEFELVKTSASQTLRFYYDDYADLGHFLRNLEVNQALGSDTLAAASSTLANFVVANYASTNYMESSGVAFWLPADTWSYDSYQERYSQLQFNVNTQWLTVLAMLNKSTDLTPVPFK